MRIGIITFHRAHNYGAVLQCYALSTVLHRLGHDVEVIDYLPTQFKIEYSIYPFRHLSLYKKVSQLVKLLPVLDIKIKRRRRFDDFIKKLPLSQNSYDETNFCFDGYDAVFFGSDQIWNPNLLNNSDNIYCGNFPKQGAQFIAYAASTNPLLLQGNYKEYFEGIIQRFDHISTREISLTCYLNTLSNNISKVVADPVLLLTKTDWARIALKPEDTDYLLIYTVPQHPHINEVADSIAKEKGLNVIEIRPNVRNIRRKGYLQTVSPNEFLGYIMYANFVLTTSFHGTALSVLFERQFLTFSINKEVDDRALNLLNSVGLSARMVYDDGQINMDPIEYSTDLISRLRDSSIDYITSSIE